MASFCSIGIAECNKTGNPSYMDDGGDRKTDKKRKVEASSVVQSSSTSKKTRGAIMMEESEIFFAEEGLRVAQEKLKRAEEHLKDAKYLKDCTSISVQSITEDPRNIKVQVFLQELIDAVKKEDASAEVIVCNSEKKVERLKENLKHAEYHLELAKGNK